LGIANTATNLKNDMSNANVAVSNISANYYVENSSSGGTATTVTNLKCSTPADGMDTQAAGSMTTAYVMKTLMTGANSSIAVTDGMVTANPISAPSVVPKYLITGAAINTLDVGQITFILAKPLYMGDSAFAKDLAGSSSVANTITLGMTSSPANIANDLVAGGFTNSINDAHFQASTNAAVRTSTDIASELAVADATVISTSADKNVIQKNPTDVTPMNTLAATTSTMATAGSAVFSLNTKT